MQLVIADTGPINYLILIGHINILPALFQRVILPAAGRDELKHRKAPPVGQQWIADPPPWAEVHETAHIHDAAMETLDAGEEDAIALAVELRADMILMDDREGVLIARSKGFRVAGTLGILSMDRHMVFSISPRPSTVLSAPVFTINKNLWTNSLRKRPATCNSLDRTLIGGFNGYVFTCRQSA